MFWESAGGSSSSDSSSPCCPDAKLAVSALSPHSLFCDAVVMLPGLVSRFLLGGGVTVGLAAVFCCCFTMASKELILSSSAWYCGSMGWGGSAGAALVWAAAFCCTASGTGALLDGTNCKSWPAAASHCAAAFCPIAWGTAAGIGSVVWVARWLGAVACCGWLLPWSSSAWTCCVCKVVVGAAGSFVAAAAGGCC